MELELEHCFLPLIYYCWQINILLRIKVSCVEIAFPKITKEMYSARHLAIGFSGGQITSSTLQKIHGCHLEMTQALHSLTVVGLLLQEN